MATFGQLFLGAVEGSAEHNFDLYDCKIKMSRDFNFQTRMIDSTINAGEITVTLSAKQVGYQAGYVMQKWYIENVLWAGKIEINLSKVLNDAEGLMREIKFSDARCSSIKERYNISWSELRLFDVTIVAESVEVETIKFSWSERKA